MIDPSSRISWWSHQNTKYLVFIKVMKIKKKNKNKNAHQKTNQNQPVWKRA